MSQDNEWQSFFVWLYSHILGALLICFYVNRAIWLEDNWSAIVGEMYIIEKIVSVVGFLVFVPISFVFIRLVAEWLAYLSANKFKSTN